MARRETWSEGRGWVSKTATPSKRSRKGMMPVAAKRWAERIEREAARQAAVRADMLGLKPPARTNFLEEMTALLTDLHVRGVAAAPAKKAIKAVERGYGGKGYTTAKRKRERAESHWEKKAEFLRKQMGLMFRLADELDLVPGGQERMRFTKEAREEVREQAALDIGAAGVAGLRLARVRLRSKYGKGKNGGKAGTLEAAKKAFDFEAFKQAQARAGAIDFGGDANKRLNFIGAMKDLLKDIHVGLARPDAVKALEKQYGSPGRPIKGKQLGLFLPSWKPGQTRAEAKFLSGAMSQVRKMAGLMEFDNETYRDAWIINWNKGLKRSLEEKGLAAARKDWEQYVRRVWRLTERERKGGDRHQKAIGIVLARARLLADRMEFRSESARMAWLKEVQNLAEAKAQMLGPTGLRREFDKIFGRIEAHIPEGRKLQRGDIDPRGAARRKRARMGPKARARPLDTQRTRKRKEDAIRMKGLIGKLRNETLDYLHDAYGFPKRLTTKNVLGCGLHACAVAVKGGKIVKLTNDVEDAYTALMIQKIQATAKGKIKTLANRHLAKVHEVAEVRGVRVPARGRGGQVPLNLISTSKVKPLTKAQEQAWDRVWRGNRGVTGRKEVRVRDGDDPKMAEAVKAVADLNKKYDLELLWDAHYKNVGLNRAGNIVIFDFGYSKPKERPPLPLRNPHRPPQKVCKACLAHDRRRRKMGQAAVVKFECVVCGQRRCEHHARPQLAGRKTLCPKHKKPGFKNPLNAGERKIIRAYRGRDRILGMRAAGTKKKYHQGRHDAFQVVLDGFSGKTRAAGKLVKVPKLTGQEAWAEEVVALLKVIAASDAASKRAAPAAEEALAAMGVHAKNPSRLVVVNPAKGRALAKKLGMKVMPDEPKGGPPKPLPGGGAGWYYVRYADGKTYVKKYDAAPRAKVVLGPYAAQKGADKALLWHTRIGTLQVARPIPTKEAPFLGGYAIVDPETARVGAAFVRRTYSGRTVRNYKQDAMSGAQFMAEVRDRPYEVWFVPAGKYFHKDLLPRNARWIATAYPPPKESCGLIDIVRRQARRPGVLATGRLPIVKSGNEPASLLTPAAITEASRRGLLTKGNPGKACAICGAPITKKNPVKRLAPIVKAKRLTPGQKKALDRDWELVGGLAATGKMPTNSYSLPAQTCPTGAALAKQKDTVCSGCYALQGRYWAPDVLMAMWKRYRSLNHREWVPAMARLIDWSNSRKLRKKDRVWRWHDSGDLQSVKHFENIVEVARLTPEVEHWLPTKEKEYLTKYVAKHGVASIPENLRSNIRVSHYKRGAPAAAMEEWAAKHGFSTSAVVPHGEEVPKGFDVCPAPGQGGYCLDCRHCWLGDKTAYMSHGGAKFKAPGAKMPYKRITHVKTKRSNPARCHLCGHTKHKVSRKNPGAGKVAGVPWGQVVKGTRITFEGGKVREVLHASPMDGKGYVTIDVSDGKDVWRMRQLATALAAVEAAKSNPLKKRPVYWLTWNKAMTRISVRRGGWHDRRGAFAFMMSKRAAERWKRYYEGRPPLSGGSRGVTPVPTTGRPARMEEHVLWNPGSRIAFGERLMNPKRQKWHVVRLDDGRWIASPLESLPPAWVDKVVETLGPFSMTGARRLRTLKEKEWRAAHPGWKWRHRMGNPKKADGAIGAYKTFHGAPPKGHVAVDVPDDASDQLVLIGEAQNITYQAPSHSQRGFEKGARVLWDHQMGDHGKARRRTKKAILVWDKKKNRIYLANRVRGGKLGFQPTHGIVG